MPFNELLALLMLVAFFGFLMAGIPVALTLATSGLLFGYIGFGPSLFHLLPNRIFGVVTNYTLIAMPLFVFMGVMLEKSRLAEDLMEVIAHAAGNLRGGLGIGIIVVGVLMGATTGIVGATVVTLGLLTMPTLLRRGYDKGLASGIICASGTLGQIIPPSLILILLADILNESVGTLFAAAMIPGLLLAGIYIVYLLALGVIRPEMVPPVPKAERDLGQARACGPAADRAGWRGARLDHRGYRRADRGRFHGSARRDCRDCHRATHVMGGAARYHLRDDPHYRDDDVHLDVRASVLARIPGSSGRAAGAGFLRYRAGRH
jgi:TRAP-type mannitol/chloroaromatic compound transport system permease large subunit